MSGTRLTPSRLQEDIRAWWAAHVKASEIPGRARWHAKKRLQYDCRYAVAQKLVYRLLLAPDESCYPQKGESILLACQVMARR